MSKENLEHIHKAYTPSNPNNLKENIRAKFCSIDKFIFASGRCFHVPFHVLFLLQPLEGREEKGQGQVSVVSTHATEQEEPGDIGVGWGLKGHLARLPTASQRGKWKQKGGLVPCRELHRHQTLVFQASITLSRSWQAGRWE